MARVLCKPMERDPIGRENKKEKGCVVCDDGLWVTIGKMSNAAVMLLKSSGHYIRCDMLLITVSNAEVGWFGIKVPYGRFPDDQL